MGIWMMAAPEIVSVEKTHSPTSLTTKLYRRLLAAGKAGERAGPIPRGWILL